jgi:hypothetical protein
MIGPGTGVRVYLACGVTDMRKGMTKEQPTVHVGIDVSKDKLAVAMAGSGVRDEVLSLGTFENAPASVDRLLKNFPGMGRLS